MMSATPIPEKPLLRNNSPAASIMRSRFAAACSRLTLMTHLSYAAEEDGLTVYMTIDMNSKYDDDHHLTAPGANFSKDIFSHGFLANYRCIRPPQHPLRMGGGRGHVSHSAGDRGGDGHAWRDDRAARTRVRVESCPNLLGFGASHLVVRPVRSVRRRFHEPLWRAPRDRLGSDAHCGGPVDFTDNDPGLAAGAAVGHRCRHWHRVDRDGARRDGGDTLVQSPTRARHRHPRRQLGDRTASVSPGDRRVHHALRVACCARTDRSRTR